MENSTTQLDYFFNEVRFKQLLGILKNNRPDYRHTMCQKSIHGVIYDVSRKYNPVNWHQLILELPHLASDGISIGYYRKDDDIGKKVTVTKAGKYLTRHFPQIPDNILRDFVSPYIAKVEIIDNLDAMLNVIINGPHSCMAHDNFAVHPYKVYNPKFGWKMAVRTLGNDNIVGRALINDNSFVRCYAKSGDNYASGADNILESWLESKGFKKVNSWDGYEIAKIEHRGQIVAPYLDGHHTDLEDNGNSFLICDDGDYEASSTNGFAESKNSCTCDKCGERMHEDSSNYIEHEDMSICEDCLNRYYVYISETRCGSRYLGGYYHRTRDCIETIDGEYYPDDSYSDFDIVELHNGDYCKLDDAICIDDDYYHSDDIGTKIIVLHNGDYALFDDVVELHDGDYALFDDAVELHDGDYALSNDVVELHDGDYALSDDVVELHNGDYALSDDVVELHNGDYALKSDIGTIVILLDDGHYSLSQWELI